MSSAISKAPSWAFAAIAALLISMAMGVGAASAGAATVTATPSTGLDAYADTTLGVSGTGFAPNTNLDIGQCSDNTYGIYGVPACSTLQPVTTNGSGAFSASLDVNKEFVNVHAFIPPPFNGSQPSSVICSGTDPAEDPCSVVVATHGGVPAILARDGVVFDDF